MTATAQRYRDFYEADDPNRWGRSEMPGERLVAQRWLAEARLEPHDLVLELGCGMGVLSDLHRKYAGLDFSLNALRRFPTRASRVNGDMQSLPFADNAAAFVMTFTALEHVPDPERALNEMARVLRPGGILLLAPAWHVRPWAAKGLAFRPYSDLPWADRLQKLTIPLRESIVWRAGAETPRRVLRELGLLAGITRIPFHYRQLTPNLDEYICTDCDAFSSMDPHAAIAWFASRGWEVLSHPGAWSRFTVRTEPVVFRKPRR
jgi:SAM-dependent methyltransferase